jgi:hypothetical protein
MIGQADLRQVTGQVVPFNPLSLEADLYGFRRHCNSPF